jgi:hypothetical protein
MASDPSVAPTTGSWTSRVSGGTARTGRGRRRAQLGAHRRAGCEGLADLLSGDEHLAPLLVIPSKDNGLDVEGLAAHGESPFVGLRGPVLRGWAVVQGARLLVVYDSPSPARRPTPHSVLADRVVVATGPFGQVPVGASTEVSAPR